MPEIIHHRSPVIDRSKGVALLMVLLIVLAITIIATGVLADADTELICGGNMLLRTQMDQLAYSALEHAKGLLLPPQAVPPDPHGLATYWVGEAAQQLIAGSQDYYDVSVEPSDPADFCTYDVTYT